MHPNTHYPIVIKNALAFLCLSVASVVLFFAPPAYGATTTLPISIQNIASTTSPFLIAGMPAGTACTYLLGRETGSGYNAVTGGASGSCNTNDWDSYADLARVQPVFSNPVIAGNYKGYIRTSTNTYLIDTFSWNGSVFDVQPISFESGYTPTYASQYDTRFTSVNFSATTSPELSVSYYIDDTEATTTQADKNPTMVRVRYAKHPETTYSAVSYEIEDAVTPTWGYGTTSVPLTLEASSTYDVMVGFANAGTALTGVAPFPLAYVYFLLTTDSFGGVATTTAREYYNAIEEQAFEYQPCGVLDIGGCISNAFIYLLYPSNESLDQFASLQDQLEVRAPFVYVYQVPDYWSSLYTTATSHSITISASTSIGTITFLSEELLEAVPLSSTVRLIVGYLLWVMLAFTLWYRVTGMFNHQEKTV